MSMPDAAMFFAAGLGTRMRPLTETRPKPLIPVGHTTLLDHALELGSGIGRKVVNVHYLGDQIRDHLKGRDIAISDETETLLDTGGGLRKALPLLGPGPVMTMNTDAVWQGPNPFDLLRAAWDHDRMGALLLLVPQTNALGHTGAGDFLVDGDGRLSRGAGFIYTGAQIVDPRGLLEIEEPAFSLNRLWNEMSKQDLLFGTIYSGKWCDVGRPDCIPLAEELLSSVRA